MTRIIISGESHISKEDKEKHLEILKGADAVFIESLLSTNAIKGKGILYPLFWIGGMLYSWGLMLAGADRGAYYMASEKYGIKIHLTIDKSPMEIYNTASMRLKAAAFFVTVLYATLNVYAASSFYDILFYTGFFSLFRLLSQSIRKRKIFWTFFLIVLICAIPISSFFTSFNDTMIWVHKSFYTLMSLAISLPVIYFLLIAMAPSTSYGRERRMAERIDQIIKEHCYTKPMLICGDVHTIGMKKYLEEKGYETEVKNRTGFKNRFGGVIISNLLMFILVTCIVTAMSLVSAFGICLLNELIFSKSGTMEILEETQ
jgi:hypothetical protein